MILCPAPSCIDNEIALIAMVRALGSVPYEGLNCPACRRLAYAPAGIAPEDVLTLDKEAARRELLRREIFTKSELRRAS